MQEEIIKDDLIKALIKEYKIDEDLAIKDVEQFINILEQNKVIEGV